MPKAYVISEVSIVNEEQAARYRELAETSIAAYGGRYIVRGAVIDAVEGAASAGRLVIVEFASMEQARAWYASSSYAPARALRETALDRRLLFVEGVDLPDAS
jgi:uncharacterized protein (DUF1330 family)